jgi:hypothetical protein
MTDERPQSLPGEDTNEMDAPSQPADPETSDEGNPWFKEGADAPDAADIEDPDAQR